jgi:hypothetical protein
MVPQVPPDPAEKEYGRPRIDQALQPGATKYLTKDEKLDLCVKRIFHGGGVPPFRVHANEIMVRTLDVDGCNSKDLTQIILRDLGLTAQVLRVANSILYNHSDRPILSIAHATTLLGWLQVRNLAGTVREIEQFAKRSPGLPELLLGSVLTAVQSRAVASLIGYPRPEEAYICGLFRNLGEILIGCHFPDEYSNVLVAMEKDNIPERAACFRVLNFSWEDLGMRVATGWNMPSQVKLSMQSMGVVGSPLDRSLASIANYGHNLTRALYRKGASVGSLIGEVVLDPTGRPTILAERDLGPIINSAAIETSQAFSALQLSTASLRLSKQAERARAILEAASAPSVGFPALDRVIQQSAAALNQASMEIPLFISRLLDAVHATGFDRVIFGLVNASLTFISGRLASGEPADNPVERFYFPMDGADGPIRAALLRREDLYVDRARDGRYDHSALVAAFNPGGFVLLPIVVERKTVACLYADLRGSLHQLTAIRPALSRVRDQIAQALANRSKIGDMTG